MIALKLTSLLSRFTRKSHRRFGGEVAFTCLPPNFGMMVSMQLFPVPAVDAPPPYDGHPPADACRDSTELCKPNDLTIEGPQPERVIPFSLTRAEGYYFIQVRAILFRKDGSDAAGEAPFFAQVESFFFDRSPLSLFEDLDRVRLTIGWPSTAIREMERYASFRPGSPPTNEHQE